MERKVALTESAARRVAAATIAYERSGRDAAGVRFRQVGDDGALRLCKTTALFAKGTVADLELWEEGDGLAEEQSLDSQEEPIVIEGVFNKYGDVQSGKFCSIARHGNGKWYVIAAEC